MQRKNSSVIGILVAAVALITAAASPAVIADEVVIDIRDLYEGDLVVDGFILQGTTPLSIEAVGARMEHSDEMYAYAWILDAETREAVWVLEEEDTRRFHGEDYVRQYEDEISLPEGRYEAYYYVGRPYFFKDINVTIENLDEVMGVISNIFGDEDERKEFYSQNVDQLKLVITAPEGSFDKYSPAETLGKNALADFTRPDDDFSEKAGFTLERDMDVKITAIGEFFQSERVFVDFGWIINAETREKVWRMDKWNTSWAGGARKNRGFNGTVELPAGNYIAHFVTDDSHSFSAWNALPPYDPLHYGMIIKPADEDNLQFTSDYVDDYSEPVIVEITRVRDNRYEYKGFDLKKEADLHIVAIGEYGYNDQFVDYGWIEDIDNNRVVWQMTEENTEYAGGATKNRRFDGVVTLPSGEYLVYYVTDGSHSYRRWNASPPYDKEMWGITVYGAGRDFNQSIFSVFEKLPGSDNLLVNLTGLGDDEEVKGTFTLDDVQKIRILSLGEGKDNRMYDYGWIENAQTGDIIWEMTYRKTRHAGGARKNRLVDTEITLDAGRYNVYFITDDSHSFPDFNSDRPEQAHKWGISIARTE